MATKKEKAVQWATGMKPFHTWKKRKVPVKTGMEEADKLWTKSGAQKIASQTPFEKNRRRKRIWQSKQHKVS